MNEVRVTSMRMVDGAAAGPVVVGRAYKVAADRGVWEAEVAGRPVVLKVRKFRGFADRVRCWLRIGPLDREVVGAEMLSAAGVATAACVGRGGAVWDGAPGACAAFERLPGRSVLEHLAPRAGSVSGRGLSVSQEHGVAWALGELVAQFVACGMHNRDHKPSNLILTEVGRPLIGEAAKIAVIDAAGVGKRAKPARMLASMYIEPLGCGCPPRRALVMRCVSAYVRTVISGVTGTDTSRETERAAVKDLWRQAARVVAEHGDPRPVDDPRRMGSE